MIFVAILGLLFIICIILLGVFKKISIDKTVLISIYSTIAISLIIIYSSFTYLVFISPFISSEEKNIEITEYKFTDDKFEFKVDNQFITIDNEEIILQISTEKTGFYFKYREPNAFDNFWFWGINNAFALNSPYKTFVYYYSNVSE